MPVLMKVNGDAAGQLIELKEEEIIIGRLPECGIVLDPNGVSRKHAKLNRRGNDYVLVDLFSRNKTKLNEREISPEQEHLLRPGDRINICDVELVYYQRPPDPTKEEPGLTITDGNEDTTLHTLDASRSDLLACAVQPEAKLKAILEITRNLSSNLQLDTVVPRILDSLLGLFTQAERVFLVLLKDGEPKRGIRKTWHQTRAPKRRSALLGRPATEDEAQLSISRSIINHVLGQKKAVLSQDACNDMNLPISASIAELKIRSVMCAPLLTPDGQALGILQLDTSDRQKFGQDDLELLVAVAGQAAIAIQNASMHESLVAQEAVRRDLTLAKQVQASFLPRSIPAVPGYQFFAFYQSAYEVGGDYYDFVPLPGDRWGVVVGDVAGKGVSAALMMAKFSGDTRYCLLREDAPAAAASRLNDLLCDAGIEDKFITLNLGVLDPAAHRLTLCSAGHPPAFIRRASGEVEAAGERASDQARGFVLGFLPRQEYHQVEIELQPGDIVVLYSDGVTDARSPAEELYDSAANPRLRRRVAEVGGTPQELGRALLQEIREFSAGQKQADDITLVCFGPLPG